MNLHDDVDRKRVLLELEIDGKVVDSRIVLKQLYEWELKKMRLRAMTQKLPWAIYKTVARIKNTNQKQDQSL